MSNLAEPINIRGRTKSFVITRVNNEEKLENTLALISSVYHIIDICYSLFLIEYPDTSDDGIAYVFHVENWTDKKAVFNNIQYGLGKPGGAHSNIFCPFLGVQCKDNKKSCQGVKICKIAKPEFKDLAVINSKCCYNNYTCNRQPVIRYHKTNRSNVNQYFIGCSAYVFGTRHRYISEKPNVYENLKFLLHFDSYSYLYLFRMIKIVYKNKNVITIPHIIDGKVELLPLVKTGCNVIFHKYESLDLESCPYIVMVVKNTHSHPPPPTHRTPNHLQQDLKSLIENSNDLLIDFISRRLISGPLIKAVFGETVLADVHASMNNIAFMDDGHIMILCVFKLQAEHMSKFKYFMVDMSYKRVFGEIDELEFNAYDENNNSVVTFCKIYSNGSNAKAYQYMFTAFFEVYEDLTVESQLFIISIQKTLKKKDGLLLLLIWIKVKQAKELSLALNSLYNSLSPEQHLLSVLKSCLIHFER
ncbi:unnamed protein product [Rhizophagus irregularis]|nr:unnamed protein product [Rhizophagus irregularis]CAB5187642.1 unnamed protein product [Rhizophagus irregularis]